MLFFSETHTCSSEDLATQQHIISYAGLRTGDTLSK